MDLIAERVEVWAASLEDKPGSLANSCLVCGKRAPISTLSSPGESRSTRQVGCLCYPVGRRCRTRSRRYPGFQPDRTRVLGARRRPEPAGNRRRTGIQTRGGGPQSTRFLSGSAGDPIHPVYRAGFRRRRREGVDCPAIGVSRNFLGHLSAFP